MYERNPSLPSTFGFWYEDHRDAINNLSDSFRKNFEQLYEHSQVHHYWITNVDDADDLALSLVYEYQKVWHPNVVHTTRFQPMRWVDRE